MNKINFYTKRPKSSGFVQHIKVMYCYQYCTDSYCDNYFDVTGIYISDTNMINMYGALNDKNSIYSEGVFNPNPNGVSYTIAVRAPASIEVFRNTKALQAFIQFKLDFCKNTLKKRDT